MFSREERKSRNTLGDYPIRSRIILYSGLYFILASILTFTLAEGTKETILGVVIDHNAITSSIVSRLLDSAANSIDSAIALHGALPSDRKLTGVSLPRTLSILSVIDGDGWLIASTGEYAEPIYLGDRRHFDVHSSNLVGPNALYVGPPVLGRVSGLVTLQLTRATRHEDGGLKSVFVASYVLDDLTRILDELPKPYGVSRAVFGFDGILRASSNKWVQAKDQVKLSPKNYFDCEYFIQCSFYSINTDSEFQLVHISTAIDVNLIYLEATNIMAFIIIYFISIIVYISLRASYRSEIFKSRAEQVLKSAKLSRYASLGQMAASFVHEVGTPAQTITLALGNLRRELALGDSPGSAGVLNRVKRMEAAIQRIASLSGALRRFSQPGDKRHKSLQEIVTECSSIVDPILKLYKINMSINSEVQSFVRCNNDELQTIVINLIDNARDAIYENRSKNRDIYVDWVNVDKFTHLRVRDTGGGISEDIIDRIFDPLFSTKADGSGIGLALVASIIKRYGGKISAQNDDLGATFEVVLPTLIPTESDGR